MERRNKFTICRLCLNESECLIDIFEDNEKRGNAPAEIITDLLQFHVSKTDGYPHAICARCFDKLTEFKCFKEQCLASKVTYDNLYSTEKQLEEDLQPTKMMAFESIKTEPVDIVEDECEDTVEDAVDDEEEQLQMSLTKVKMEPLDVVDNLDLQSQINYQPAVLKQEELIIDDVPAWGDLAPVPLKLIKISSGNEVSTSVPYITVKHQPEDLDSDEDQHDMSYSPMDMVQTTLDADSQPETEGETAEERMRRVNRERQRKRRQKQSEEEVAQRRILDRQRHALMRRGETTEEAAERRRRDALRVALKRLNESPEQSAIRRSREAKRKAMKRRNETPEQTALRRRRDAQRVANKRLNETPEEAAVRRRIQALRTAMKRRNETPEQTTMRRNRDAERVAIKRLNETPEEAAIRKRIQALRVAMKRQNETPEEAALRRRKIAEKMAMRRLNETPEEKAERMFREAQGFSDTQEYESCDSSEVSRTEEQINGSDMHIDQAFDETQSRQIEMQMCERKPYVINAEDLVRMRRWNLQQQQQHGNVMEQRIASSVQFNETIEEEQRRHLAAELNDRIPFHNASGELTIIRKWNTQIQESIGDQRNAGCVRFKETIIDSERRQMPMDVNERMSFDKTTQEIQGMRKWDPQQNGSICEQSIASNARFNETLCETEKEGNWQWN